MSFATSQLFTMHTTVGEHRVTFALGRKPMIIVRTANGKTYVGKTKDSYAAQLVAELVDIALWPQFCARLAPDSKANTLF